MAHMNIRRMPPLPTIRLRVWHVSDFAPVPDDSLHLSRFLGSFDTGSWHVHPAEVMTEPCRDGGFVPVEVDIKYRPTSRYHLTEASTELHRFFRDVVEARVGELFKRANTTAVLVHMYPVGDDVTETLKRMFLRVKFLQPLNIQSGIYAESHRLLNRSMLEEGQDLELTIIHGCSNALLLGRPGSSVAKACCRGLEQVFDLTHRGPSNFEEDPDLRRRFESSGGLVLIREAILHFSEYQKSSQLVVRHLQEANKTRVKNSHSLIAGLRSTALAAVFSMSQLQASCPVSMVTASFLSALAVGVVGIPRLLKCHRNESDVESFDGAMKDFQKTLRMAQFGLGVLFSHQTLEAPCSWLEDGNGAEVLKSLGIDISQLKNEEYSEKFALDSLASLSEAYQDFEKLREDIRRQAGLRECTEATMPSSTPNGNGDPMDCQED
ncbi:uncharacterized protein NECHADRAFT_80840 [Fusarium vanettenii 77-13-4]|uniref:Uncharacterized protein n=1 Tax=Fusarium vanettenii (strain ATCC MYA-4622 / CBS 123669 / FGSC 9596 / NRRL 45880 / 77-13-4) TaxID=660122 RepID=C7YST0_FUSV7|nr:uncharacterized protein NECHADRAFT_80840 [Fusarium vanettenii 77-13-4]EEU45291.1 predicted protein [Fusarium vanettenii 77-13-4]